MTFTPAEIDGWLEAAYKKVGGSEFQEVYKAGWRDGITAVMIEFDNAMKCVSQQSGRE